MSFWEMADNMRGNNTDGTDGETDLTDDGVVGVVISCWRGLDSSCWKSLAMSISVMWCWVGSLVILV